jgi:hypothetical protein
MRCFNLPALPMPEWEYTKIDLNDLPPKASEIDVLNDAGKDGWELVLITSNNIAFLKRPRDGRSPVPAPPSKIDIDSES